MPQIARRPSRPKKMSWMREGERGRRAGSDRRQARRGLGLAGRIGAGAIRRYRVYLVTDFCTVHALSVAAGLQPAA